MRGSKDGFNKQINVVNYAGIRGDDVNIGMMKPGNGFCELIENAGGVPFQLIFGSEPGKGFYLYMGDGIKDLTGLGAGEITEEIFHQMIIEVKPLNDHIPESIPEARAGFIRGEIRKYSAELLIQTPGGIKKWIHDSSLPLRDEDSGKIIGSYGILFDISEKKNAITHLNEAKEKANECENLKNAFLQNISHEVRTPLNAIIGFSTLLCDQDTDHLKKQEFCDIINNSTDHFLEVMDNILEISRIETQKIRVYNEEINPDDLMKRLYEKFIRLTNQKKLFLGCEIPKIKDYLPFRSDSYKIFQIMNNLLSNAVKFTYEGEIFFGFRKMENFIEFYVTDTGVGINDKYKPMMFSKFFQVEPGFTQLSGGIGLGLAISRSYVQMLGGQIDFFSHPGKGSTFWFTIPLSEHIEK